MTTVDIADEAFSELDYPTDVSIASIAFWLETNIGNLNTLLSTDYTINSSRVIVDGDSVEITKEVAGIFKQMYRVHRTKADVRKHLGAAGTETVISVDSDGASVRRVNKTTLASEYRQLSKDEQSLLDKLVQTYKQGKSLPKQVAGDDTVAAIYDPEPDFPYNTNLYSRG